MRLGKILLRNTRKLFAPDERHVYISFITKAKTLAQENGRLRSDSAKMKKDLSDLRSAIDEQAQYTRRDCLEIRGVPVTTGKDTNIIVKKIGALIDVDINDTDISISHRIPSFNDGASGSTSFQHPAIAVKFTNRKNRDPFLQSSI